MLNLMTSENSAFWAYLMIPDMFSTKRGSDDNPTDEVSERDVILAKAAETRNKAA